MVAAAMKEPLFPVAVQVDICWVNILVNQGIGNPDTIFRELAIIEPGPGFFKFQT